MDLLAAEPATRPMQLFLNTTPVIGRMIVFESLDAGVAGRC
jgi:hypothetical protein